jgi:uncharacterized protein RhaS with RHS repeats
LDYFGFRYYSRPQGRWTSPDDIFADQHPEDPQSWNLYAYVRNNPIKNTDPNGRDCFEGLSACGEFLIGVGSAAANSIYGAFNLPTLVVNAAISPFTDYQFPDLAPTIQATSRNMQEGQTAGNIALIAMPLMEASATKIAGAISATTKAEAGVAAQRNLSGLSDLIRDGGQHPAARNNRVIAVGENSQGELFAGSSNGLDKGQRAIAKENGIAIVRSKRGAHAEENVMRDVPDLKRIGTSRRSPCGPSEHNCARQLSERGVEVENK